MNPERGEVNSMPPSDDHYRVLPRITCSLAFANLTVNAKQTSRTRQPTFSSYPIALPRWLWGQFGSDVPRARVLHGLDGFVGAGETLLVLGAPGSGCSTFLKIISAATDQFEVDSVSRLNYDGTFALHLASEILLLTSSTSGAPFARMRTKLRSTCAYCADEDVHFSELTVSQTLAFAHDCAHSVQGCPAGNDPLPRYSPSQTSAVNLIQDFGLGKCASTKVGSYTSRGISGGERRRVTLAEAYTSQPRLKCWDGCTSGLDSVTALNFVRALCRTTQAQHIITVVTMHQASQTIFDSFDKIMLLHEGRELYFGRTDGILLYFAGLGFVRSIQETTPDFLISLNMALAPGDLADAWQRSIERRNLSLDIETRLDTKEKDANGRIDSVPKYSSSTWRQVQLCLVRAWQRSSGNLGAIAGMIVGNIVLSLIIGSVFYDLRQTADSMFRRSVLLFYITTVNSFLSAAEVDNTKSNQGIRLTFCRCNCSGNIDQ